MRTRRLAALLAVLCLAFVGWAAPAHAAPRQRGERPITQLFDNVASSDDGKPAAADFDGTGKSLSAQRLRAAGWTPGRSITLLGTRLTWPDVTPGRPDNVIADGQAVTLRGRGEAVTFLVSATGGAATGTGKILYRDGTRSSYRLFVPDWITGDHATKALSLSGVNTPRGRLGWAAKLYARTVPVDPGKIVKAVVLPASGGADLHVFAVSLRKPLRATGTWAAGISGNTPVGPYQDQTLRLVVHSSAGGPLARIRLDNAYAERPLRIGAASIAVQSEPRGLGRGRNAGAVPAGRPVPLTFRGAASATVPAGGQLFSDPAPFRVPPNTNLLVSVYLPERVDSAPTHTDALLTSYSTPEGSGDHTGDTSAAAYTGTLRTWPFLSGVDVRGGPGTVVALGDSITDGTGSTFGANRRWPDQLTRRLLAQSAVPRYGVVNEGISANQIVHDRFTGEGVGPATGGVSAQHRLERDVLSAAGVRTVVVFEGINDMRALTPAQEITAGLRAIAERSRAHGLRVIAATVVPCAGYWDCGGDAEARRQAVNAFIREQRGTLFDAVVDFDAVVRDPAQPSRMFQAYDSGDHLHPGDAGLKAIADSCDLRLLAGTRQVSGRPGGR